MSSRSESEIEAVTANLVQRFRGLEHEVIRAAVVRHYAALEAKATLRQFLAILTFRRVHDELKTRTERPDVLGTPADPEADGTWPSERSASGTWVTGDAVARSCADGLAVRQGDRLVGTGTPEGSASR